MGDDEVSIADAISILRKDLKKRLAPLARAAKALDAIAAEGALDDLAVLGKHEETVRDVDLSAFGMNDAKAALASQLAALHDRLTAAARAEVLGELMRQGAGLEIAQITEHPLTVLISPIETEIDLSGGRARILYAREVIDDDLKVEARAILEAREKAMARIRDQAVDSPVFFETAHRAYRAVLLARGFSPGERVDIVDLLAPLALFRQEVERWRGTDPVKAFPRYLLAYQLHRMQRDGLLVKDGLRMELGTATGGSTRNKRDVIFIPASATEGQYYLSIRFVSI
ncbi:MAG: hypothetical protein AB1714_27845 [Acidobacteriota bacterium]